MSASLRELVRGRDGRCHCPKCPVSVASMDQWVTHVSDAHDPYREFVERWSNLETPDVAETPDETEVEP